MSGESLAGGLLGSGRVVPSPVHNRFSVTSLEGERRLCDACKRTVIFFRSFAFACHSDALDILNRWLKDMNFCP